MFEVRLAGSKINLGLIVLTCRTVLLLNGHTDQASVPTAGGSSHTFNIPKDQGKWIQVCVNSGNRSVDRCHTYETIGGDMSVSLSAK